MRILLTNDDGVNARGLKVLEAVASKLGDEIWVVAPTEEQSGAGHSLTLTTPVRLRRHGERRFSVAGVPSIALSQAYSREGMGDTVPFAAAEAWAERVLAPLLEFPMDAGTLINV